MKSLKALALIALLALAGCKKKEEAPPASTPATAPGSAATAAAPAAQPIPPAPAHIASQAENSVQAQVPGVADAFLTSQLRIFIKDKGRLPQSFTEFARTRLDSIPRAPEGCKWAIDSVNKEVRAVRQQ